MIFFFFSFLLIGPVFGNFTERKPYSSQNLQLTA